MELDPIVLLAYVSVAVNIITVVVAAVAYSVFHVRRRRRKRSPPATAADTPQGDSFEPVFLKPWQPGAPSAHEPPGP